MKLAPSFGDAGHPVGTPPSQTQAVSAGFHSSCDVPSAIGVGSQAKVTWPGVRMASHIGNVIFFHKVAVGSAGAKQLI